jgi:hypothetical protein
MSELLETFENSISLNAFQDSFETLSHNLSRTCTGFPETLWSIGQDVRMTDDKLLQV